LKKEQQQTNKTKIISQIEIPLLIPGQKKTMASKRELIREQRASSFTKKEELTPVHSD